MFRFWRLEVLTLQAEIFTIDRLQDRQLIGIVFGSTSLVCDSRHISSCPPLVIQWQVSVFWAKETLDHYEIALFYYQTIPHEILRLVDYLSIENTIDRKVNIMQSQLMFHYDCWIKSRVSYFDEGHLRENPKIYGFVALRSSFNNRSKPHFVFFSSREIEKTGSRSDRSTT